MRTTGTAVCIVRFALLVAIGVRSYASAQAETLVFSDSFDSYANQAAFQTAWPVVGAQPSGTLSTTQFASSPKSIFIPGTTIGSSAPRNEHTFAETGNPSATNVIRYSFDFYDSAPAANPERNFANIQDAAGTLSGQLVSMGLNNNLLTNWDGGNYYMARIVGYTPTYLPQLDPQTPAQPAGSSGAYFKLNEGPASTLRSAGWHNLAVDISDTEYKFYVDNTLAKTISYTPPTPRSFDNVRLGSGLSNNNQSAYFDNVKVFLNAAFGVPGDYNNDGVVDLADIVLWRAGGPLLNEVASPGVVDDADYIAWEMRHGDVGGAGSGSSIDVAIPEPNFVHCLVWATGAFVLIFRSRRRGRRWLIYTVLLAAITVDSAAVVAAPTIHFVKGGAEANNFLDSDGNWVIDVKISNSSPVPTGRSPLAAELGFREVSSVLIGAERPINYAQNFDTPVPGVSIFGWEQPDVNTNGRPKGLQTNCTSGCTVNVPGNDPNSVFSAFLSVNFDTVGPHDYLRIKIRGPSMTTGLTTTLGTYGAYGGNGRISELNSAGDSVNYDTYQGTRTVTAIAGDASLDGVVDSADYDAWTANIGTGTKHWFHADFNDDNTVNSVDLNILLTAVNRPGDFNFNGAVDVADYVMWRKGLGTVFVASDYDIWRSHFGQTIAASFNSATVPEPSVLGLSLIGVILLALARKSGRRAAS